MNRKVKLGQWTAIQPNFTEQNSWKLVQTTAKNIQNETQLAPNLDENDNYPPLIMETISSVVISRTSCSESRALRALFPFPSH